MVKDHKDYNDITGMPTESILFRSHKDEGGKHALAAFSLMSSPGITS